MHYIIKYFPEMTIKSKPVRKQMCRQLQVNLRRQLRSVDAQVEVVAGWDSLRY